MTFSSPWMLGFLLPLGFAGFIMQGTNSLNQAVCNNMLGIYGGDLYVGIMTVINSVKEMMFLAMHGFGAGAQPVLGYNYGAQLYDRLRKALRFCIIVASIYAFVVAVLGEIFAPAIISAFRNDPEVIRLGAQVLRAQCLAFPLIGFVPLTNMYLQTTNQTVSAVTVAIARHGLFLIPALIIGATFFGLKGIIAAQPVSDVLSFILALPLCIISVRKLSGQR